MSVRDEENQACDHFKESRQSEIIEHPTYSTQVSHLSKMKKLEGPTVNIELDQVLVGEMPKKRMPSKAKNSRATREKRYIENKKNILKEMRRVARAKELEECTFRPKILSKRSKTPRGFNNFISE